MIPPPFSWIEEQLARLADQDLLRQPSVRSGPQGPTLTWNDRVLVNFGSNDYLGLAGELTSAWPADRASGWGSGASPMISGRGRQQAELELELARFENAPAALLFSSGYAANVGTLTALLGKEDVVFSDARNHASIIDGCRLSGARIVVFPHGDVDSLREKLREIRPPGRRLIVTDSLFSMDGDFAPLESLTELAEAEQAMLVVDEAHATGVFGRHGRGLCEHLGVETGCPVRVGTLSKALGSMGGFVVGPAPVIRWLANRARPYFFSTAPPDAVAAAGRIALGRVIQEPLRREQLLERAAWLRDQLTRRGWEIGPSQSQIIPVILGSPQKTMHFAAKLREQGLFVPGIRPPSVPSGHSLLRVSLCHGHTPEHLEQLLAALNRLTRDAGT